MIYAAEEFLIGWTLLLHYGTVSAPDGFKQHRVTSSAIHSTARPGLIGSVAHIGLGGNRAGDHQWRGSLIHTDDHASRVAVDPAGISAAAEGTIGHVVDHLSAEGRSRVMAAIRSRDTKPELALRAGLRAAGATGYRIHAKVLPGKPDVAFTRWRVAVFVDGVFWHGHPDHFDPARASDYWRGKIARNQERDRTADAALVEAGWTVLRFWDQDVKADATACVEKVLGALADMGWARRA